jgi:flagellar biosynthesis protein FlhG
LVQPASPQDRSKNPAGPARAQVIAVTSGKGGVGKTNVTTNLGIALASQGARVCIFDADTSLANINILLGLRPKYTLADLLSGEKSIDEIILEGPRGVHIIPAASGLADCANLDSAQLELLFDTLNDLENQYDYLLLDTAAGIGETVLSFVSSAQYAVVVISPEPTSLTDAFALIKVLKQRGFERPIYVLVNMVASFKNSMDVFKRFQSAVQDHLQTKVSYLGYITLDETVISAVHLQRPVVVADPGAPASRCFHVLAEAIGKHFRPTGEPHSFSRFWRQHGTAQAGTKTEPARQSKEVRPATPRADETWTLPAITDLFAETLRADGSTAEEAGKLLQSLIETFVQQFQRFPMDFRKSLYRSLELEDFPQADMRDVVLTLEAIYEKRFQHPIRDTEGTVIKLLSDVAGSPDKIKQLARQLQTNYRRQCAAELFDAQQELIGRMQTEDYSEADFVELMKTLQDAYEKRFGHAYRDEKDTALEDIRDIAKRMTERDDDLLRGLARLSEWFNETVDARQEILNRLMTSVGRDHSSE